MLDLTRPTTFDGFQEWLVGVDASRPYPARAPGMNDDEFTMAVYSHVAKLNPPTDFVECEAHGTHWNGYCFYTWMKTDPWELILCYLEDVWKRRLPKPEPNKGRARPKAPERLTVPRSKPWRTLPNSGLRFKSWH